MTVIGVDGREIGEGSDVGLKILSYELFLTEWRECEDDYLSGRWNSCLWIRVSRQVLSSVNLWRKMDERRQKGGRKDREVESQRRKVREAQGNTMNTGINRNQRNQIFIKQQLSFLLYISALIGYKSFEIEKVVRREVSRLFVDRLASARFSIRVRRLTADSSPSRVGTW